MRIIPYGVKSEERQIDVVGQRVPGCEEAIRNLSRNTRNKKIFPRRIAGNETQEPSIVMAEEAIEGTMVHDQGDDSEQQRNEPRLLR